MDDKHPQPEAIFRSLNNAVHTFDQLHDTSIEVMQKHRKDLNSKNLTELMGTWLTASAFMNIKLLNISRALSESHFEHLDPKDIANIPDYDVEQTQWKQRLIQIDPVPPVLLTSRSDIREVTHEKMEVPLLDPSKHSHSDLSLKATKCEPDNTEALAHWIDDWYLQQEDEMRPKKQENHVCCLFMKSILERIKSSTDIISQALETLNSGKFNVESVENIVVEASKLNTIQEYIYMLAFAPASDLMALPVSSSIWKKLNSLTQFRHLGGVENQEAVEQNFENYFKELDAGNAFVAKSHEQKNAFLRGLAFGWYSLYYKLDSKAGKRKAEMFFSNPDPKVASETWNLLDSGIVRKIFRLSLPKIATSKLIYLPRLANPIDWNEINDLTGGKLGRSSLSFDSNPEHYSSIMPSFHYTDRIQHSDPSQEEHLLEHQIKKKKQRFDRVPVRVIADEELGFLHKGLTKGICCQKPICEEMIRCDLVVHMHGGGFISMTSNSHENYTRVWSKKLKLPIFSIDYRLAPEHRYPAGLNDCWHTYQWLVNNAQTKLGIMFEKVILIGDSAGGNMVFGVTQRAIQTKFRVPDSIVLVYPSLNMSAHKATPSYMNSLDDRLLKHTFIRICRDSYLPAGANPDIDPYLSPLVSSDQILAQFPPTQFVCGKLDPFYDDSCRMMKRLDDVGVAVKMLCYENLSHGFLNFACDGVIPHVKQCHEAVRELADILKELITPCDEH